ncbi:MAG: hypothetical protein WAK17_28535 [Candidatus Nitrosopolaris sp.]
MIVKSGDLNYNILKNSAGAKSSISFSVKNLILRDAYNEDKKLSKN